jgi:acetolactate synthase-1/2/3 large subunit|tara:strand:- start:2840 stop:4522 length:1683 start_codon:yes stop_codon:yes gene_type:complete
MRGSEAVVALLRDVGVEVIFGLCGDTSLPFYEALATSNHGIRHVLTRDERSASFMADAYARLSGRVGVCEGPSGGGATYILPGLAEANASSVPLVCLTSDIARQDAGRGTLTELNQTRLFEPVTRSSTLPTSARELVAAIGAAFRDATTGPLGAAHVVLPYDVQLDRVADAEVTIDPRFNAAPAVRPEPTPDDVRAAADRLVNATRPLLVAGAGVLRSEAWDEVTALAELLGMPVATSIGGKGSIAETHPYALGVIGSNGGLPFRHDMLRQSDVIFYVGTRQGSVTTEKWTLPSDGEKTLVQLDVEPTRIGHNYQTAVGLVADAKRGLAALVDEITDRLGGRPAARTAPDEVRRRRDAYMASIEEFTSDRAPIRSERFVAELSRLLPPQSIICADPGTPCPYLSAYYQLPQAGRWFVSPRAHGALGYALPAVCGAYFARPDAARVVGVMGDGSFGISAGELETIARLNLPVTLIVLNNASYGWIKAGQRQMAGGYFSVDFSRSNHAAIAEAYGIPGIRVESPHDLRAALDQALAVEGPALVDVIVQPLEQARAPVSKWVA